MSEEPTTLDEPTGAAASAQPSQVRYIQDALIPVPRSEMPHLSDEEYETHKAQQGHIGTEHDEKFEASKGDRESLMMQLGITASGRAVAVQLLPESMTRGDIDVRGTRNWSELSQIHYLYHELARAKVATPRDTALYRILDPIMQGGESHPNAIGLAFMGKDRSKGRPGRATAFSEAMKLVQHGSPEQRQAIISEMERRLAIAKGEPNPVVIAKQLVLDGMPGKDDEGFKSDEL